MYRKNLLILSLLLFVFSAANAQSGDVGMDLRLGIGATHFQPIDKTSLAVEMELNKKFTPYFTVAPSIMYDKSERELGKNSSLLQFNLNGLVSPFRNNLRNDFRLGGGIGYSFLTLNSSEDRNSLGFNIIVENSFFVKENFFIGIKGYTQYFLNKDVGVGLMLKAGMEF